MKAIIENIKLHLAYRYFSLWQAIAVMVILWLAIPILFRLGYYNVGFVDPGIWHVLLLAFICWFISIALAWVLWQQFCKRQRLNHIQFIYQHFNQLTLWEQYVFHLAVFALLLCSATGTLIAIC